MAYRRSNGKGRRPKKIEPAVKTLWFSTSVPAEDQITAYIDISQCASLLNRRFYRQGLNWVVEGFDVFTSISTEGKVPKGRIVCSKLPETWVLSNSWEKSFRHWQGMNEDALESAPSIKPRFLDFKIYADQSHHQLGFAGNLLPVSAQTQAQPGEWEDSQIVLPTSITSGATTSFDIIATGASYPGVSPVTTRDAVSMIEGYAASRGLPVPVDPNKPDDADDVGPSATPENWMGALTNEGTLQDTDVITDLMNQNNQAPYPFENDGVNADTMYPGGANQLVGLEVSDYSFITPTTVGGEAHLRGGLFPCGLVRFDIINDEVATPPATANMAVYIGLRLVPGNHRGYLCQPMQDM